jgi:SAM-dependent methyltransferase
MILKSRIAAVRALAGALADRHARSSLFRAIAAEKRLPAATCSCCGYVGRFYPAGLNARLGQLCPSCRSYERHRLVALAFERGFLDVTGKEVIHFAPEQAIRPLVLKDKPASYVTADIDPGKADRVLDLEQIDLPDATIDVAIASHVLEHVDDRKALSELRRILKPGGKLIALVPLVEGWAETFEDPSLTRPEERQAYFGRYDHVRFYGADFRDRIIASGFHLDEFTAGPIDSAKYRLSRGEKVFLATKLM